MMLYVQTKQGDISGPFPEDLAEKRAKAIPGAILITEFMRKQIIRNREIVRRQNMEKGL